MQRYFLKESYEPKGHFILEGETYHHIVQVMRMEPKDGVFSVFNDQIAVVTEITKIIEDTVYLKEVKKEEDQKELLSSITIASGYPKGEKLDWATQKSTELGTQAFIGFPASASVVKWDAKKRMKRRQRPEKIAQEAAGQSHRQTVPSTELLEAKRDLFERLDDYDVALVACEESAKRDEKSDIAKILSETKPGSRILAVFGPEGSLSHEEIDYFVEHKGILCGLGPGILRTETASLYSLSIASCQWGLMDPSHS